VLLVDDEAGIRRSVGRFLRRYGCEVQAVATGTDAIEALANKEFDVVISDIRMPGLTGKELYRMLEQGHPHMTSRIIFMSGDLMRAETRDFLEECGCPSLQKPYELADLVRILEELWDNDNPRVPQPAA
jgi:DNA-binding NtrC family response regulator